MPKWLIEVAFSPLVRNLEGDVEPSARSVPPRSLLRGDPRSNPSPTCFGGWLHFFPCVPLYLPQPISK